MEVGDCLLLMVTLSSILCFRKTIKIMVKYFVLLQTFVEQFANLITCQIFTTFKNYYINPT